MDKSNVFKSSNFFMSEGDILHMIIIDEAGVPMAVDLQTTPAPGEIINVVPGQVVTKAATAITSSSFTANWNLMENATGYYLDVATDLAFTSMVSGFNNKDVGLVNEYPIVGLTGMTTYYYRIRGYNDYGTGLNSNLITQDTMLSPIANTILIKTLKTGIFDVYLAGTGNITVDWGDGASEVIALGTPTHQFHTYTSSPNIISIPSPGNIMFLGVASQQIAECFVPPEAVKLTFLQLSTNPLLTSFTTHNEWIKLETFSTDFCGLTSLVCHPEWIKIILLQLDNNPLTTFTAHHQWVDLQQLQLAWCSITSATDINNILIECEATVMGAGNTLFLKDGTNAAPTGAGIVSKNNLLALGVIVTTN